MKNKQNQINKFIDIKFNNSMFKIIKKNHLFDERKKNKQRDQYVSNEAYKEIIKLSLINGLTSFRSKGEVVITVSNSKKSNHSCTSFLVALDNENNISIITAVQCYGNKKWHVGFSAIKNRINIVPSVYFIPRMSEKELENKKKDKIFNHSTAELAKEDKLFQKYIKYNKL